MKILSFRIVPIGRSGNYKLLTLNDDGNLYEKEFFNDSESEWKKIEPPISSRTNKNGWIQ